MKEALPENFILLSKVAKEKKYAQEYLGLLARRGDIGSIRIGKRWYTTWAWFEEFLENGKKKKIEDVCEIKVFQPVVAEPEKIAVAVKTSKEQITIRKNIAVEKAGVSSPVPLSRPAGLQTGRIKIRRFAAEQPRKVPIQNFAPRKMAQSILQDEPRLRNSSVEKKNKYAVPYQEIRFKKKTDVFSPNFSEEGEMRVHMFPQFAFAAGFAIMVLLAAASVYFVWSGGLLTKGTVAGVSDERNVGFSGITSGGEYVLVSAGDKMKESLSVSRVMVEAAKEKVNQENLEN